jgi:hemin uptake protein HemP
MQGNLLYDDQEESFRRSKTNLRRIQVETLLRGEKEIILMLGDEEYHLQLTKHHRLLLTK